MTKYLLDTTVLVDFLKGRKKAIRFIEKNLEEKTQIGTTAINIAEVYSGIPKELEKDTDKFINSLGYFDISRKMAKLAGLFRFQFFQKGVSLSIADSIIAATALSHDATVVTANIKDFPQREVKVLELKSS